MRVSSIVNKPGITVPNPSVYWKLDEVSGNRSATYGSITLTDTNTVTSAAGKQGNAAQFTAANSETLGATSGLSNVTFGDSDFTFTGWVYLDSKAALQTILRANQSGTTLAYMIRYESGSDRIKFYVESDAGAQSSATASSFGSPSLSTWYFITAIHDSVNDVIKISVNNGAMDTTSVATGTRTTVGNIYLGSYGAGEYWDGRIDEIGFWNSVLTSEQIAAIYNGGAGRTF